MYVKRRKKLLEMLEQYSVTVLMAGKAPYSIGDAKYPFQVDRSFYYYTGLDKENLVLVLVKLDENTTKKYYLLNHMMNCWLNGLVVESDQNRQKK